MRFFYIVFLFFLSVISYGQERKGPVEGVLQRIVFATDSVVSLKSISYKNLDSIGTYMNKGHGFVDSLKKELKGNGRFESSCPHFLVLYIFRFGEEVIYKMSNYPLIEIDKVFKWYELTYGTSVSNDPSFSQKFWEEHYSKVEVKITIYD